MFISDFKKSTDIGNLGECIVSSYLIHRYPKSVITKITSKELQKLHGDFYWTTGGQTFSIDVKTEKSDRYGNFFFEYWSNRQKETRGWGLYSQMSLLVYFFLKEQRMFFFNFKKFQSWAYRERNIFSYPLKKQGKYDQLNDSWGHCVPITFFRSIPSLNVLEVNTSLFYTEVFLKNNLYFREINL